MAPVPSFRKVTPILVVDRIEPILPFWKKLGVTAVTEVPDEAANDGRLAFVILVAQGVEIMYQTLASVKDDLLKSATDKEAFRTVAQQSTLYVEVSDLAAVESLLADERQIVPRRTTFYGSREAGYTDPAGNIVVFAEQQSAVAGG